LKWSCLGGQRQAWNVTLINPIAMEEVYGFAIREAAATLVLGVVSKNR